MLTPTPFKMLVQVSTERSELLLHVYLLPAQDGVPPGAPLPQVYGVPPGRAATLKAMRPVTMAVNEARILIEVLSLVFEA